MTFYFHVHRQGRTITKSFARTRDRAPKQAAGVAYFNEQGELLLCKRRPGIADHPGEWSFPAGGVEPGETPAAAARREFKEELAHSLPSLAQQPAVENGSFTAYVYWGETFAPRLDHEHTECGWFHTEHLPEPMHPGVVAVLEAMPSVVLAHLLSERAATQDADFKEDEHPRDSDGKFTAGAGSNSGPKPTKATAKGSKAGVHELLSSGHPFTVEELMEATGSTNRVTITTALSDLKNPKYAGALGHLAITKRPDGMYHVEKVDSAASAEVKAVTATSLGLKTKAEQDEEAEKRYGKGSMARARTREPVKPPVSEDKVPTGALFHHQVDDVPMGKSVPGTKEHVAEVSLRDIVPTQSHVKQAGVDAYKTSGLMTDASGNVPEVIAKNGKYYLLDGHHRIAAGLAMGLPSTKVRVVATQGKAPPASTHKTRPSHQVQSASPKDFSQRPKFEVVGDYDPAKDKIYGALDSDSDHVNVVRGPKGEVLAAGNMADRGSYLEVPYLGSLVKGGGSSIVRQFQAKARKEGKPIRLNAAGNSEGFYEKMGFRVNPVLSKRWGANWMEWSPNTQRP